MWWKIYKHFPYVLWPTDLFSLNLHGGILLGLNGCSIGILYSIVFVLHCRRTFGLWETSHMEILVLISAFIIGICFCRWFILIKSTGVVNITWYKNSSVRQVSQNLLLKMARALRGCFEIMLDVLIINKLFVLFAFYWISKKYIETS